jgi:hypothetical protein
MRVQKLITFDVETDVDDDELTEDIAHAAISSAVWGYLTFVKFSGGRAVDDVEVHVDGFGECVVSMPDTQDA